jgi:hypothetical protein
LSCSNNIKHSSLVSFALLGEQVNGLLHQLQARVTATASGTVCCCAEGAHPAISLVHFALLIQEVGDCQSIWRESELLSWCCADRMQPASCMMTHQRHADCIGVVPSHLGVWVLASSSCAKRTYKGTAACTAVVRRVW